MGRFITSPIRPVETECPGFEKRPRARLAPVQGARESMSQVHYVIWKDEYSVEIAKLDAQHRKILEIINELYHAMRGMQKSSTVWKSLMQLMDYTMTHLTEEEEMMRKCEYPDLASHKDVHNVMRRKIVELIEMHRKTAGDLSFEVLEFLKEWWIKHILGMDREYIPCLTGQ